MQSVFSSCCPSIDDDDESFDSAGLLTLSHSLSAAHQNDRNMKVAAFLIALCASLASAAVVKTPVFDNQIVPNQGDDCALGVTTPQGCA